MHILKAYQATLWSSSFERKRERERDLHGGAEGWGKRGRFMEEELVHRIDALMAIGDQGTNTHFLSPHVFQCGRACVCVVAVDQV